MKDKIYLVFDKTKSSLKIKSFLNRKPITNDLNTEKNLKNSILFNKLRNSIKVK